MGCIITQNADHPRGSRDPDILLGALTLCLCPDGRDAYILGHGSKPWFIGRLGFAARTRMLNWHVLQLYGHVRARPPGVEP
jgi:hypothetical protein